MTIAINLFRDRSFDFVASNKIVRHYYTVANADHYTLGVIAYNDARFYDCSPTDIASDPTTYFANLAGAESAMLAAAWTNVINNLNSSGDPNAGNYVSGVMAIMPQPIQDEINAKSGASRSFATPSRTIGTAFQISTTRDCHAVYSIPITSNATVLAGSQGSATFQYADNSGMSTNVVTLPGDAFGIASGILASGIGSLKLMGIIPANKWVNITKANVSGTPTFGTMTAQEVLL